MAKRIMSVAALTIVLAFAVMLFAGAESSFAVEKPGKAKPPCLVGIRKINNRVMCVVTVRAARADYTEIYIKKYGRYIKTVKKGTKKYKKYKKSKKYILVHKKGKKYGVYKKYKKSKSKWKLLDETNLDEYTSDKVLSPNKYYGIRFRGVNTAGKGKYSQTIKFTTYSKSQMKSYKKKFDAKIAKLDEESDDYWMQYWQILDTNSFTKYIYDDNFNED